MKFRAVFSLALLLSLARGALAFGEVEVQVLYDRGRYAPQYPVSSDPLNYRAYLEAAPGRSYSLQIRNNSGFRVGLVVAVDGLNILSGQHSALGPHERMYVLEPNETGIYEGWRSGRHQVNRFYFTDLDDSYAYAWNDTAHAGVIAVAAYRDAGYSSRPRQHREHAPNPGIQSTPGTGFGEGVYSPSVEVAFRPESSPASRYFIRYEWRADLCRLRVIDCGERQRHGYRQDPPRYSIGGGDPLSTQPPPPANPERLREYRRPGFGVGDDAYRFQIPGTPTYAPPPPQRY